MGHQGEDSHWLDQIRFDQEQVWQDCEQEAIRLGQEEQLHQGLDYCSPEGQEGFGPQGLRCDQEGLSSLQKGQGILPVSTRRCQGFSSGRGDVYALRAQSLWISLV